MLSFVESATATLFHRKDLDEFMWQAGRSFGGMSEQAAATPERRFLVTVRKPWKLWIWPAIALFYFLWVLLVVLVPIRTGVPESIWVLAGLGLFGLILLIQLLLLPTRKVRVKKAKAAKRAKAQAAEAVPVESLDDMNAVESEAPAGAAACPSSTASRTRTTRRTACSR